MIRRIARTGATTEAPSRLRRSVTEEEETMANALSDKERTMMDAYWRAANYLSVGQIYLYDNPLLKQPLTKEHIKPRLLGHWGTTPGLNFIYVHLNRLIKKHDLDMIYITGPEHGGPALSSRTPTSREPIVRCTQTFLLMKRV
jgi:phosphoketolase